MNLKVAVNCLVISHRDCVLSVSYSWLGNCAQIIDFLRLFYRENYDSWKMD